MAKAATPPTPQPANLTSTEIEKGIRRLGKALARVREFKPADLDPSDPYSSVRPLSSAVETALSETFKHGTIEYNRFRTAAQFNWPLSLGSPVPHHTKIAHVTEDHQRSIQLLEAAIELLTERLEDAPQPPPTTSTEPTSADQTRRVFIVHGHDAGVRDAVARFLTQLAFEPIILHERPNRGRTIISKFREEASEVGFAIVIITPDDSLSDGTFRPRQNVILELGFFLGALGAHRVATIVKHPVDTPSDYDGVVYISYESDWKLAVAKELKAAGYEVDVNLAMR